MRAKVNPEIARAINKQAHFLAAQSFASIRMALEDKARELLKAGKDHQETIRVIRLAGLPRDEVEQ